MAPEVKVPIPPNGKVVLDDEGIPIGSYWGTKGPGRYELTIEGLLSNGSLYIEAPRFVIAGEEVRIKILDLRKISTRDCPAIPPEMLADRALNLTGDPDRDWEGAWELGGFVPGCAVGVRGVYGTRTRIGRFDLWDQFTQTYTCERAKRDLATFFMSSASDGTAEAALSRAIRHIADGAKVIGGRTVRCQPCEDVYKALRRSAEA
jgi:hypothetical protein